MTASIHLTNGTTLRGDTLAGILRDGFGPEARLFRSGDPNEVRYGQVVTPSEGGGFAVLAGVSWIDTDERQPIPLATRQQEVTEAGHDLADARMRADMALDALRQAVVAACDDGMPESEAARLGQIDRMTVRKWRGKR